MAYVAMTFVSDGGDNFTAVLPSTDTVTLTVPGKDGNTHEVQVGQILTGGNTFVVDGDPTGNAAVGLSSAVAKLAELGAI